MILLIGATGYIGSEFARQLKETELPYLALSHTKINKGFLLSYLDQHKITHVINCAAFVGKPNVEACESKKDKCILGNILLPSLLKEACEDSGVILCHISTGCLYNGEAPSPYGWNESHKPNFSFKFNNCGFYTGTKVVAEEIVQEYERSYTWRIRLPFENRHNNRNYISKILNYDTLIREENSLSHKSDFVKACIDSILLKIPFGAYNITNTGSMSAPRLVEKLLKTISPHKKARYLTMEDFYKQISSVPRSNCITDNRKITALGISLPCVNESIDKCLESWKW